MLLHSGLFPLVDERYDHAPVDVLATENIQGRRFGFIMFFCCKCAYYELAMI